MRFDLPAELELDEDSDELLETELELGDLLLIGRRPGGERLLFGLGEADPTHFL